MTLEHSLDESARVIKSQSAEQTISLDGTEGTRTALAKRIAEDLDTHTEELYFEGFRNHLGASVIGDECKRRLWYIFRWCNVERPSGRIQRLFNRGHLEESRIVGWLKGMGFEVWTHDESQPQKPDGTYPQYRINNSCGGHFGGSVDGIVRFPAKYNIAEPALLSVKTSGTGAGFNKIEKDPLQIAKPEHFAQESVYGRALGIKHVLYMCVNKNDDSIAVKVEKLDFQLAEQLEIKAESIIFAQDAPPRVSQNSNFPKCKNFCEFKDVCHNGREPVKNCRSCVYCYPREESQFYCKKWDAIIPGRKEILKGCSEWVSINGPTPPPKTELRECGQYEIETVPLPIL